MSKIKIFVALDTEICISKCYNAYNEKNKALETNNRLQVNLLSRIMKPIFTQNAPEPLEFLHKN
jgi:hypothetical protein